MKKVAIVLFFIISSFAFSQKNASVDTNIFGKWKTVSFTSKGKYYHNFDNDSLIVYYQNYFKGAKKSDSLNLLKMLKENSQESKIDYQFNADSTCIVTNFDHSVNKNKFSFNQSTNAITFNFINPNTQKPDFYTMKFGYVDNQTITLQGGIADSDEFVWKLKRVN